MKPKYELTKEKKRVNHHSLFRIKALRGFGVVEAGSFGGFIEGEKNLSHDGIAWVGDDACVFNDACVFGNVRAFPPA
jgi:hypothetical protein